MLYLGGAAHEGGGRPWSNDGASPGSVSSHCEELTDKTNTIVNITHNNEEYPVIG